MKMNTKLAGGGYQDRAPRVSIRWHVLLTEADGCEVDVVMLDVSGSGFRLQSNAKLEPGSEVLLRVAKLAPVRALIRWTCGDEAGGVFLDPVAL